MNYTKEILNDIMLDAQNGFTLAQIADRLNISYAVLYADYCNPDLPVKMFYDSGVAKGKSITDNALFELAKNGSTSAKQMYDQKISDARLSNKFREIFDA